MTENDFHGAELGLAADWCRGPWSLDVLGKLGLGNVHQQLAIAGSTAVTVPGDPPVVRAGALLAQATNIGQYSDDQFALLPELGVDLGYQVTPALSLHVGYTLLYLTQVLRTGDQLDLAVGSSGAPGDVARPIAALDDTSLWVQGLNLGVEWRR